jgi:exodeoxyribonuclease V gamma subunit
LLITNQPIVDATPRLPTGFMVLHGNRLEDLRDLLTRYLKANPLGVLEPEIILLQSNGMKHWLELALADDAALGICAATRMELPSGYLWQLYRAVLGAQAVPAHMPFDKTRLLWRLVRLLPALCASNPVYQPLQRYLSGSNPARKLYQLAQQVADVLDGYQSYRADWLTDWAGGQDQLRAALGLRQPLPPDHAWQAHLWRDIRSDLGEALADASRASVHARFMAALNTSSPDLLRRLPRRLIVFGVSSLPMQTVQALAGLGQHCQVLMLVQNPCQYYWGDLVEGHAQLRQQVRRRQPAKPALIGDLPSPAPGHPLLASWGKQGRDYLHLLDGFDAPERYLAYWRRVDVFVDPAMGEGATLPSQLVQLQSAMLNLTPPPAAPVPQTDDGSICLVTAHSAQRELEVLHDRLLAWFDEDADLQPREVMVMVPNMATFAPHIHAVFGRFRPGEPRFVPFSVADTTARQSPLVQALESLLSLPTSRLSLADWLSLFEVSAVRARFKLKESDVQQLQTWVTAAGVRWGLNAAHRIQWGMPQGTQDLDHNSWAFGLRRLLLGYAVGANADQDFWQGTLAQPALSGLDAPLLAGLLAWLEAVELTLPTLQQDQTPDQWGATLRALVERFFTPADFADERALASLLSPLDDWLRACEEASLDTPLPLEVVREHWLSQIQDAGLQQRFFGGGVQFGTLMPMRSIPFKVIALLGMNDGDYPRVQAPRDFDLMTQTWRAGDRSRREDDRYLFLEALLSARQRLYVSWQGHSASDNSARPPSVLVAQLLDHVNACWAPERKPQAQPLQAFSPAYFGAGSGFETYDKDWEQIQLPDQADAASKALENVPNEAPQVSSGGMPQSLTLADLQRLLRQPVEVFFRNRLQVEFDSLDELEQTDEPFAFNALQAHQAGAAMLKASDNSQAAFRLRASGQFPLAGFGELAANALVDKAQQVRAKQEVWWQAHPETLPAQAIDLLLDDDVRLTGTLGGLLAKSIDTNLPGATCLQLEARPGAVLEGGKSPTPRGHVLMRLWVNHLAACASGLNLTSALIGVDGEVQLAPMDSDNARAILNRLIRVYAQAWTQPLPVACKTAWAYLLTEQRNTAQEATGKPGKDPHEEAQKVFEGGQFGGERAESAYLQRAFATYDDLTGESSDGLPHWAEDLYGDLLTAVTLALEGPA